MNIRGVLSNGHRRTACLESKHFKMNLKFKMRCLMQLLVWEAGFQLHWKWSIKVLHLTTWYIITNKQKTRLGNCNLKRITATKTKIPQSLGVYASMCHYRVFFSMHFCHKKEL